jgi:hypothetical protein
MRAQRVLFVARDWELIVTQAEKWVGAQKTVLDAAAQKSRNRNTSIYAIPKLAVASPDSRRSE